MTPKERVHATIRGESHDRPAVTPIFMAWAANFIGRTYRDYYLDGDVLAQSQLAVAQAFHLDQVSAISDPWREASAYGMEFDYPENGVGKPGRLLLQSAEDVSRIEPFEIEKAPRPRQRVESVRKMAQAVGGTHSVLGWVEGPLAEYADLRGVENMFMDLIDRPEMYLGVVEPLVENAIRFAKAQIKAGADMIGVGDAVASLISPPMYERFVLPFEKRLFDAIHEAGAAVKLHICGDISNSVGLMARTGCDILDVDWMVPLNESQSDRRSERHALRQLRSRGGPAPGDAAGRGRRRPNMHRDRGPTLHPAARAARSRRERPSRTSGPSAPAKAA